MRYQPALKLATAKDRMTTRLGFAPSSANRTWRGACYAEVMLGPVYAAAIALVALIGNFRALHKAVRLASRGRQWSVSQK